MSFQNLFIFYMTKRYITRLLGADDIWYKAHHGVALGYDLVAHAKFYHMDLYPSRRCQVCGPAINFPPLLQIISTTLFTQAPAGHHCHSQPFGRHRLPKWSVK